MTATMPIEASASASSRRQTTLSILNFLGTWLLLATAYYLLCRYLYDRGFVSLGLMFFAEKSQMAMHGAPPRLVNIGFVYPPLSFLLMLPFRNMVLAQAVIASGTITWLLAFIDRRVPETFLRRSAKAYILLSPLFLFPATEDYGFLLLAVMLGLVVFYLGRYLEDQYSLHLFAAGIIYGLTFFIDFRSVYLLIVLVPAITLPLLRSSRAQALSVWLAIAVPIVFMALAWMYINWIFLGDALAFVHGRSSFFRSFIADPKLLAVSGDPGGTLWYVATMLLLTVPITCCYFLGLYLLRSPGSRITHLAPAYAVYAVPIVLAATSVYAGVFAPAASFLILFLITLFFEFPRMHRSRLLPYALLVSFAASCFAPLVSPNPAERDFAHALYTGVVTPNLTDFRNLADYLQAHRDGRVLLDDTIFYPAVYLADDPQRFILPYQYEYETALSDPRLLARYVVASRRGMNDAVTAVQPSIQDGKLKGFRLAYETGPYLVFERTAT